MTRRCGRAILSNLGFGGDGVAEEDFYMFQCCKNKVGYLVYRSMWATFYTSCFIAHIAWVVKNGDLASFFFYLTHLVEISVLMYFNISLATAIYGYRQGKKSTTEFTGDMQVNENGNGHLITATKSTAIDVTTFTVNENANESTISTLLKTQDPQFPLAPKKLRWFHKTTWLLHELCFAGSFSVTGVYWIFQSRPNGITDLLINLFQHGIGLVALIVEGLVTRYPCRLMHAIYSSIYGVLYVVFTFVLYHIALRFDPDNLVIPPKTYWFLDYSSGSLTPVYLSFAMVAVQFVLMSFLLFLKYIRELWYKNNIWTLCIFQS